MAAKNNDVGTALLRIAPALVEDFVERLRAQIEESRSRWPEIHIDVSAKGAQQLVAEVQAAKKAASEGDIKVDVDTSRVAPKIAAAKSAAEATAINVRVDVDDDSLDARLSGLRKESAIRRDIFEAHEEWMAAFAAGDDEESARTGRRYSDLKEELQLRKELVDALKSSGRDGGASDRALDNVRREADVRRDIADAEIAGDARRVESFKRELDLRQKLNAAQVAAAREQARSAITDGNKIAPDDYDGQYKHLRELGDLDAKFHRARIEGTAAEQEHYSQLIQARNRLGRVLETQGEREAIAARESMLRQNDGQRLYREHLGERRRLLSDLVDAEGRADPRAVGALKQKVRDLRVFGADDSEAAAAARQVVRDDVRSSGVDDSDYRGQLAAMRSMRELEADRHEASLRNNREEVAALDEQLAIRKRLERIAREDGRRSTDERVAAMRQAGATDEMVRDSLVERGQLQARLDDARRRGDVQEEGSLLRQRELHRDIAENERLRAARAKQEAKRSVATGGVSDTDYDAQARSLGHIRDLKRDAHRADVDGNVEQKAALDEQIAQHQRLSSMLEEEGRTSVRNRRDASRNDTEFLMTLRDRSSLLREIDNARESGNFRELGALRQEADEHERIARIRRDSSGDNRVLMNVRGITMFNLPNIMAAGQAISAIVMALGGVVAAAAAAGTALAAMGGTAIIGGMGVAKAFSALMQANKTDSGKDAENAAKAQADALDRLADAKKRAGDAAEDLRDKEKALADSYGEANRAIRDQNMEMQDAVLQQEGSAIAVARARERYQDVLAKFREGKASGLDLQEARLGVKESQSRLKASQNNLSDTREDTAKVNRKGIEGSDQVQAAKKGRDDAQDKLADALKAVARAQRDLASAGDSSNAAMNRFDAEMKKLSPNARDFVNKIRSLSGEFSGLRRLVEQNMFAGLGDSVASLARNQLPELKRGMGELAGTTNKVFKQTLSTVDKTFTEFANNGTWSAFLKSVDDSFKGFAPTIDGLVRALTGLTVEMGPAIGNFFTSIGQFLTEGTPMWADFGRQTLDGISRVLPVLNQLFGALLPIAAQVMPQLERAIGVVAEKLDRWKGALGGSGGALGDAFVNILEALGNLIPVVTPLITGLATIVGSLNPGFLAAILGGMLLWRTFVSVLLGINNGISRMRQSLGVVSAGWSKAKDTVNAFKLAAGGMSGQWKNLSGPERWGYAAGKAWNWAKDVLNQVRSRTLTLSSAFNQLQTSAVTAGNAAANAIGRTTTTAAGATAAIHGEAAAHDRAAAAARNEAAADQAAAGSDVAEASASRNAAAADQAEVVSSNSAAAADRRETVASREAWAANRAQASNPPWRRTGQIGQVPFAPLAPSTSPPPRSALAPGSVQAGGTAARNAATANNVLAGAERNAAAAADANAAAQTRAGRAMGFLQRNAGKMAGGLLAVGGIVALMSMNAGDASAAVDENGQVIEDSGAKAKEAALNYGMMALMVGPMLFPVFKGIYTGAKKATDAIRGTAAGGRAMGALSGVFTNIGRALGVAATAAKGFMLSLMANPIFLAIAAVVAIGVALWAFFTKTETGRKLWDKLWNGIKNIVSGFVDWLKKYWPLVLAILTGPIGMAVYMVVKHWDKIKAAVSGVLGWLRKNWPTVLAILTGPIGLAVLVIAKNWDKIKNGFGSVGDFFRKTWDKIVGFFQNNRFVQALLHPIDSLKKVLSGLADFARGALKNVGSAMVQAFTAPIRWLGGLLKKLPSIPLTNLDDKARSIGDKLSRIGASSFGLSTGGDVPTAEVAPGGFVVNARASARNRGLLEALGGTMLSGPGTGTSDSILGVHNGVATSRVSNGEIYFGPEKVAGIRGFLNGVNSGAASQAMLDGLPRFQTGGELDGKEGPGSAKDALGSDAWHQQWDHYWYNYSGDDDGPKWKGWVPPGGDLTGDATPAEIAAAEAGRNEAKQRNKDFSDWLAESGQTSKFLAGGLPGDVTLESIQGIENDKARNRKQEDKEAERARTLEAEKGKMHAKQMQAWRDYLEANGGWNNRHKFFERPGNAELRELYNTGYFPPPNESVKWDDDSTWSMGEIPMGPESTEDDDSGTYPGTDGDDPSINSDDGSTTSTDDAAGVTTSGVNDPNLAGDTPEGDYQTRGDGNTKQAIIIHTTEGDTAAGAMGTLQANGTSYHVLIDENGKEHRLVADDGQAKAAFEEGGKVGLHVAMTGFTGSKFSEQITTTLAARLAKWSQLYNIPLTKISPEQLRSGTKGVAGHGDVTAAWGQGTHTDPGPNFDYTSVLNQASKISSDNPATTTGEDGNQSTSTPGSPGYGGGEALDRTDKFIQDQIGKPYLSPPNPPANWDCSMIQSGIYASLTNQDPMKRYFTTEGGSKGDFEEYGFVKGLIPGAYQIGVHRGGGGQLSHMAGTMPNGDNVESGGSTSGVTRGSGAAGASDSQFELQWSLTPDKWVPVPSEQELKMNSDYLDDPLFNNGDEGSTTEEEKDKGIVESASIDDAKVNGIFNPLRFSQNVMSKGMHIGWDWGMDFFGLQNSVLAGTVDPSANIYTNALMDFDNELHRMRDKKDEKSKNPTTPNVGNGDPSNSMTNRLQNGYEDPNKKKYTGPEGAGKLTLNSPPEDVAAAIIGEAGKRGYSNPEAVAELATSIQESGLKMVNNPAGWNGFFQQDSSYPGRNDPNTNITGFFDRLDEKTKKDPGSDIWKRIFWLQQRPGEKDAETAYQNGRQAYLDEIKSKEPDAQAMFDKIAGSSKSVNKMRDGGLVRGPGGRREDLIPTMLSDEEFITNADSASEAGPLLEWVNSSPSAARAAMGLLGAFVGGVNPAAGAAVTGFAGVAEKLVAGAAHSSVSFLTEFEKSNMSVRRQAPAQVQVKPPVQSSNLDRSMTIENITTANMNQAIREWEDYQAKQSLGLLGAYK